MRTRSTVKKPQAGVFNPDQPADPSTRAGVRILHLEDNRMDANLIELTIRRAFPDAPITHVETREQYIGQLKRSRFDLILSDYRLPGYDGDQALAYAYTHHPDIPFIMVTGELGEDRAIETLHRGAWDYILKDNLKRLVPAVERALTEAEERRKRAEAEEKLQYTIEDLTALTEELRAQTEELRLQNEQLDEARVRFQDLFEFTPDAYLVTTPEGSIKEANKAAVELLRIDAGKLKQMSLQEFAGNDEESINELNRAIALFRRGQAPKRLELPDLAFSSRKRSRTDNQFFARVIVEPVYSERGVIEALRWLIRDVTAQKRTEQAWRTSEQRYRKLFEASLVGAYLTKTDGTILDFNDAMQKMLGYATREELFQHRSGDFYADPHFRDELIRLLLKDGIITSREALLRRKDGSTLFVLGAAVVLKDETSGEPYIQGVAMDITERKRAEESLRQSEEKLKFHVENSPLAVVEWDAGFAVTRWSREAERIFGWSPAEILGKRIDTLNMVHEEDIAIVTKVSERLAGGKERTVVSSNRNYTKDGRVIECVWYNSVLVDSEGKMSSVMSLVLDITDRKLAEQALADIARFPDENPLPVARIGHSGALLYTNAAYDRVFGLPPVDTGPHQEVTSKIISFALEALAENAQQEREISFGGRIYSFITVPVPERRYANLYGRDITERRRVREELERLNVQLEERVRERTGELAAANKELESFTYSVSHDLKAPLRAIAGFASLLLEESAPSLSGEHRQYLKIISDNAANLGKLIEELLIFSRLSRQEVSRSTVDMRKLFEDSLDGTARHEPGRPIHVTIGDLPEVSADPVLIGQVIENLISNAKKFTRKRDEDAAIEIGSYRKDGEVIYYVKDNGAGFDMKYYDKLFGVFQRLHTSEEYEGTGVGLAFCQRIIERHGGRIWAEGKPGEGATFYFSLPYN